MESVCPAIVRVLTPFHELLAYEPIDEPSDIRSVLQVRVNEGGLAATFVRMDSKEDKVLLKAHCMTQFVQVASESHAKHSGKTMNPVRKSVLEDFCFVELFFSHCVHNNCVSN